MKNLKKNLHGEKNVFEKVQSNRFCPNDWVKLSMFCESEERRVILLKHAFIWSKGYSIPMWFFEVFAANNFAVYMDKLHIQLDHTNCMEILITKYAR